MKDLIEVFLHYYDWEEDAYNVAARAGIDRQRIDASSDISVLWGNILDAASKSRRMKELIQILTRDWGDSLTPDQKTIVKEAEKEQQDIGALPVEGPPISIVGNPPRVALPQDYQPLGFFDPKASERRVHSIEHWLSDLKSGGNVYSLVAHYPRDVEVTLQGIESVIGKAAESPKSNGSRDWWEDDDDSDLYPYSHDWNYDEYDHRWKKPTPRKPVWIRGDLLLRSARGGNGATVIEEEIFRQLCPPEVALDRFPAVFDHLLDQEQFLFLVDFSRFAQADLSIANDPVRSATTASVLEECSAFLQRVAERGHTVIIGITRMALALSSFRRMFDNCSLCLLAGGLFDVIEASPEPRYSSAWKGEGEPAKRGKKEASLTAGLPQRLAEVLESLTKPNSYALRRWFRQELHRLGQTLEGRTLSTETLQEEVLGLARQLTTSGFLEPAFRLELWLRTQGPEYRAVPSGADILPDMRAKANEIVYGVLQDVTDLPLVGSRIILMGDSGMGKTATLRHIERQWALPRQARSGRAHPAWLPILLTGVDDPARQLSDYWKDTRESVLPAHYALESVATLDNLAWLFGSPVALLIDGIQGDADGKPFGDWIVRLAGERYLRNCLVLSYRTIGHVPEERDWFRRAFGSRESGYWHPRYKSVRLRPIGQAETLTQCTTDAQRQMVVRLFFRINEPLNEYIRNPFLAYCLRELEGRVTLPPHCSLLKLLERFALHRVNPSSSETESLIEQQLPRFAYADYCGEVTVRNNFEELLDLLPRLYLNNPDSAEDLAFRAGLPVRFLRPGGDINNMWMQVLQMADQTPNGLERLIGLAQKDHPKVPFPIPQKKNVVPTGELLSAESLEARLARRYGFLTQSEPLRFRHRLLADYFLARYLASNWTTAGPELLARIQGMCPSRGEAKAEVSKVEAQYLNLLRLLVKALRSTERDRLVRDIHAQGLGTLMHRCLLELTPEEYRSLPAAVHLRDDLVNELETSEATSNTEDQLNETEEEEADRIAHGTTDREADRAARRRDIALSLSYYDPRILTRGWIPEGFVPLTNNSDAKHWAIGRFPVTNREYYEFLASGDYENNDYWPNRAGRAWREQNQIMTPAYWTHWDMSRPSVPVVGVSFHEALAYTRWLTAQQNRNGEEPWEFGLPTEQEWHLAAGLGDILDLLHEMKASSHLLDLQQVAEDEENLLAQIPKWQSERLISLIRQQVGRGKGRPGIGMTVGLYPPTRKGVYDLFGNIWQWCDNWYGTSDEEGENLRPSQDQEHPSTPVMVCGGAFGGFPQVIAGLYGGGLDPFSRVFNVGFRVVRRPKTSGTVAP